MATDNKYDRQLRLWGPNGQKALMEANILLINAGPTGTETLKNLVLPGVGRFTVIDDGIVSDADTANNFFVDSESIGQPRAKVVCELLCEMNPDVTGNFREINAYQLIETDISYFRQFDLIIASQITSVPLKKLAEFCWNSNIPLLVVRSYGLIGYLRFVSPCHEIIDSKPSNELPDLRIVEPFPELKEFSETFNLDALDDLQHAHVPFVVILTQLISKWKDEHGGNLPSNFEEKNEFKNNILKLARNQNELNFIEAFQEGYKAYTKKEVPAEIFDLFEDEEVKNLTPQSSDFKILLRASKEFFESPNEGNGYLPLSGEIPDMVSTTEIYVTLQRLYQAKAQKDRECFTNHVRFLLESIGRNPESISQEEISRFCKNAYNVLCIKTSSIEKEYNPETAKVDNISMAFFESAEQGAQIPLLWYFALRAVDRFAEENGHYPGENDETLEEDAEGVFKQMAMLQQELGVQLDALSNNHAIEMTRYGACELHNIAAILGGIAAQEVVKILTKQYQPINNTLVYNGISGMIGVYEL